jgi:hypothetical protein
MAGRVLYVDNVSGNDSTGAPNQPNQPYANVQTSSGGGAYGAAQAGDCIILRGRGKVYNGIGLNNCWLRFLHKSNLAVIGYPGDTVNVLNMTNTAVSGVDRSSSSYADGSKNITLANLIIQGNGTAGVINHQIQASGWREVNLDLSAPGAANVAAKAGGLTGNGSNMYGRLIYVHDIYGSTGENHGVYIDGDGSYDYDLMEIAKVASGYGFQTYCDGTNGSASINNVKARHVIIHDITGKGALNIADNTASGINYSDFLIYNAHLDGVRLNSKILTGAVLDHFTLWHNNTGNKSGYAEIGNDDTLPANALALTNSIICPLVGQAVLGGMVGLPASILAANFQGDPGFVNPPNDFTVSATNKNMGYRAPF